MDRGDIATGEGTGEGETPAPQGDTRKSLTAPPPRPRFVLLPRPRGRGQCVAIATGKPYPGVTVDAISRLALGGAQQRLRLAGINGNLHPYGKSTQ